MSTINSIVKRFNSLLPDKEFLTPAELTKSGLFGSASATLSAIRQRKLPSVRVSNKRTLIPKESVLKYIENNFSEADQ